MPTRPNNSPSIVGGCKISEGPNILNPRRLGGHLGAGGEAWRMSPKGLYDAEVKIRSEIKGTTRSELTLNDQALLARRLAGMRGEARAGYAVDGLHHWTSVGRHPMYISQAAQRVPAATSTLEDILDALHALDRIADTNIVCFISFKEASPTSRMATIHQYVSRGVMQLADPVSRLSTMVQCFRDHIAQPSTDKLTNYTSGGAYQSELDHREILSEDETDEMIRQFEAVSVVPDSPTTDHLNATSAPFFNSTPPSYRVSSSATCPTLASVLDFGVLAEKALAGLNVSESTILKIKFITVAAEDRHWVTLFEEAGLSKDAAGLVSLILKQGF